MRLWNRRRGSDVYVRVNVDGRSLIDLCDEDGEHIMRGHLMGHKGQRMYGVDLEKAARAGVELNSDGRITDGSLAEIIRELART